MKRDTTRAADGEGRPHRCSYEEVSKRSIISSKHSSGLHLWFFHRPDNIPDDASRMTIATSGSHLRGQHRWGWSRCGWAAWGRGERSQRSKPSINFDTSHRIFLSKDHHLQLNLAKTELLVVPSNSLFHHNFTIQLGSSTITPSKTGLPASSIKPLQLIQNAAARLIFNEPKRRHVTPLFINLHWLPVAASFDPLTLVLSILILFYLFVFFKKK